MRERLAYLHLPKAAGTSFRAALAAFYGPDDTVPWSFDRYLFGDADRLDEVPQPIFLGDPAELSGYRYMEGHWSLPTILSAFEPADVVCLLREPRARFLSQYTFWRSWGPDMHASWQPFDAARAARQHLGVYATDRSIAFISDNLACRLLLGPHPLVPVRDHIAVEHVGEVARLACEQIDRLGHVDVVERGDDAYVALESWFGEPLRRERLNETDLSEGPPVDVGDLLDPRTLAAVHDRCTADLQVWHHVHERATSEASGRGLADGAFATAVARTATAAARSAREARDEPPPHDRWWRRRARVQRTIDQLRRGLDDES